ncbi:hypothetical protein L7F22_009742 [Adiantum nelumboides]|nr:hypothetical protein [Adiantum nelumboides]
MITPPLSISAMPRLTRAVPCCGPAVSGVFSAADTGDRSSSHDGRTACRFYPQHPHQPPGPQGTGVADGVVVHPAGQHDQCLGIGEVVAGPRPARPPPDDGELPGQGVLRGLAGGAAPGRVPAVRGRSGQYPRGDGGPAQVRRCGGTEGVGDGERDPGPGVQRRGEPGPGGVDPHVQPVQAPDPCHAPQGESRHQQRREDRSPGDDGRAHRAPPRTSGRGAPAIAARTPRPSAARRPWSPRRPDRAGRSGPPGRSRGAPQPVAVAAADDEQPHVRALGDDPAQRGQQHRHALAGLVEAADVADPHRGRQVQCRPVREPGDVDAVGDLGGVPAQVLDLDPAGGRRHRDPRRHPLQQGACHGSERGEDPGPLGGGVEGRDDRPAGVEQRERRHRRGRGLVDVQHVEVVRGEPAPGAVAGQRAEREAGDGAVVGDADGPPGRGDELGRGAGRRRQDLDRVPERAQRGGQVQDMALHSPCDVEGVRADDPDPHPAPTGWSMCQSHGRRAIMSPNASARCWTAPGPGGTGAPTSTPQASSVKSRSATRQTTPPRRSARSAHGARRGGRRRSRPRTRARAGRRGTGGTAARGAAAARRWSAPVRARAGRARAAGRARRGPSCRRAGGRTRPRARTGWPPAPRRRRGRAGASRRAPRRGRGGAVRTPRASSGRSCASRRRPVRRARRGSRRDGPGAGCAAVVVPRGRRSGPRARRRRRTPVRRRRPGAAPRPASPPRTRRRSARRWCASAGQARGASRELCRTARIRWPRVTAVPIASTTRVTVSAHGTPMPDRNAPTRPRMSRSARSTRPPSAVSPTDSARALTYDTIWPPTRATSAAGPARGSAPPVSAHQASPANRAPSTIRSQVESSTAPNGVPCPRARAIAPSIRSVSTNRVTSTAPRASRPVGRNASEQTTAPTVPSTVTVSGLTPRSIRARPTGSVSRLTCARANRFSIGGCMLPCRTAAVGDAASVVRHRVRPPSARPESATWRFPRRRQLGPGLGEQLRDHLGLPDDGDEVRVPAPARHDVLVQVLGQRPAGDVAQVQADVERVRRRDLLHGHDGLPGERHQLGGLGVGEVLQLRDVPVGQHHQVPRVVRVQVQQREHLVAAGDDEVVRVRVRRVAQGVPPGDPAERAAGVGGVLDVGEPVRGPQPGEAVGRPGPLLRDPLLLHEPILGAGPPRRRGDRARVLTGRSRRARADAHRVPRAPRRGRGRSRRGGPGPVLHLHRLQHRDQVAAGRPGCRRCPRPRRSCPASVRSPPARTRPRSPPAAAPPILPDPAAVSPSTAGGHRDRDRERPAADPHGEGVADRPRPDGDGPFSIHRLCTAKGAPGAAQRLRPVRPVTTSLANIESNRPSTTSPSTTPESTRTPGPDGIRNTRSGPGVGTNPAAGSSAVSRNSMLCPRSGTGPPVSLAPPAIRNCSATRSIPVDSSVTGCSTCNRGVDLRKDRVRPRRAGTRRSPHRRSPRPRRCAPPTPQLLLLGRGEERGGCLLDELLVAALLRAVPQPDDLHRAVRVGQHLGLDVPGPVEEPFDEALAASERRGGLADGAGERLRDAGGVAHHLQAAPPPPNAAFTTIGSPCSSANARTSPSSRTGSRCAAASGAPTSRAIRRAATLSPSARMVSGGARSTPVRRRRRRRRTGVLGEEPVAGVHRVGARGQGRRDQCAGIEVGRRGVVAGSATAASARGRAARRGPDHRARRRCAGRRRGRRGSPARRSRRGWRRGRCVQRAGRFVGQHGGSFRRSAFLTCLPARARTPLAIAMCTASTIPRRRPPTPPPAASSTRRARASSSADGVKNLVRRLHLHRGAGRSCRGSRGRGRGRRRCGTPRCPHGDDRLVDHRDPGEVCRQPDGAAGVQHLVATGGPPSAQVGDQVLRAEVGGVGPLVEQRTRVGHPERALQPDDDPGPDGSASRTARSGRGPPPCRAGAVRGERGDHRVAGLGLVGGGDRVLQIGDDDVGPAADDLREQLRGAAGHEQDAAHREGHDRPPDAGRRCISRCGGPGRPGRRAGCGRGARTRRSRRRPGAGLPGGDDLGLHPDGVAREHRVPEHDLVEAELGDDRPQCELRDREPDDERDGEHAVHQRAAELGAAAYSASRCSGAGFIVIVVNRTLSVSVTVRRWRAGRPSPP